MKQYLSRINELTDGFKYPSSFMAIVSADPIIDLEPWWFLCEFEGFSDQWLNEIRRQYPQRNLIPFAKIEHSDDVACFDALDSSGDPKIYYIHAFASPGWEDRGSVENFEEWLGEAKKESARYKAEQAEGE